MLFFYENTGKGRAKGAAAAENAISGGNQSRKGSAVNHGEYTFLS